MRVARITRWLGDGAVRALANLGGTKLQAWIAVFLLLAILTIVLEQISEFVRQYTVGPWWPVPLIVLAAFTFLLRVLSLKAARSLEPRADVEAARPVKVLILLLSPPGPPSELTQYDRLESLSVSDLNSLGRLPWRMPLIAIAHHLARLELVIVLCSPDPGTLRYFKDFKDLVLRLLPADKKKIKIETSGEYLGIGSYQGVDFEEPTAAIAELGQVYQKLNSQRVKEHDILIDVTGGTKMITAAGVVMTTLLPDRKFQCVSTNTYKVTSFDVTWDMDT